LQGTLNLPIVKEYPVIEDFNGIGRIRLGYWIVGRVTSDASLPGEQGPLRTE
jgi:hypothetical protein